MKTNGKRACPVCGTLFPDSSESCPVCALQGALKSESGASSIEDGSSELRFEHYRVLQNEDGTPIELGRGAMGVTYKAVDVNLRLAVALKVINARFVGDESARRRFVREARSAASVRHPNVATVFHLGKSGDSYFYAMEFVDGEPLDEFIRRSGELEPALALEITTQIAAGLAAVQKQNLVHRDIKPGNIMVSLEVDGATAKIIDLGLAKGAVESQSETAVSVPGSFAGTPEFASPEQFAGVGVDIRSDLYSLGAMLWQMLSGDLPFRGTPAELMHQHLHATLPIGQLGRVPQPLVALLEVLLEKDPVRRFQNPLDLLKATPTVRRAMEAGRILKRQKLRATLVDKPGSQPRTSPATKVPKRSIAVLPFDTLSQDKGNTYFADGVHDEILSNLAKVSRLRVISRTSVMMYRPGGNWNLRSIFTTLGVAKVLEGTVRRDDNRIRITVRLVDARRGEALWADSYDRDLTDIFAIQSEVAQTIASKLMATLSPEEKKRIEAKPTENLKAYDLYLRTRKLMTSFKISAAVGNVEKVLCEAINLLEKAVRIDPKFALAHCASAQAHDLLYFLYDPTPERRALGDAAVDMALTLEPDLPEAHITCANHLYRCYRDYERARVQLAMAKQGLPNDAEAIMLEALMDRRQGNFEKAIQEFNEAMTRDPRNSTPIAALADTLVSTRQFYASEQAYDRAIHVSPDQPLLRVKKAYDVTSRKTGDNTDVCSAIASLPASIADDRSASFFRLFLALNDRDWLQAKELLEKINGGEDDGEFAYGQIPVPVDCYTILITRLQEEQFEGNSKFVEVRQDLSQRAQRSPAKANLVSQLAVVDALLNNKAKAISEAKRAVEMLPVSRDAMDGPGMLINLAVVYAWTDEPDLAFATLAPLTNTPGGIYYGQLKADSYWEPLRKDPRFDKLLAELAPKD